jgi:glycine/D-amino acid oxidase-like deaminating enzyme
MEARAAEFDVVVAGSGAAGLTAALTAAHLGLSVLVIEKAGCFGGSTTRSGGGIWAPGNTVLRAARAACLRAASVMRGMRRLRDRERCLEEAVPPDFQAEHATAQHDRVDQRCADHVLDDAGDAAGCQPVPDRLDQPGVLTAADVAG